MRSTDHLEVSEALSYAWAALCHCVLREQTRTMCGYWRGNRNSEIRRCSILPHSGVSLFQIGYGRRKRSLLGSANVQPERGPSQGRVARRGLTVPERLHHGPTGQRRGEKCALIGGVARHVKNRHPPQDRRASSTRSATGRARGAGYGNDSADGPSPLWPDCPECPNHGWRRRL